MIPQDDVKVTVQKGRVTLTGEVKWEYQRKAAEGAIQRLSGVTGVTNRILLKPEVLAPKIKTKIEAALARHAHVEAQAI